MLTPFLKQEDWSRANSLNQKTGGVGSVFRSFGLDLITRSGFVSPKVAFVPVTGGPSAVVNDILYAINDSNIYLGANNAKLYKFDSPTSIVEAHTAAENIQALKEYKGLLIYAQATKVGKYDFATFTDGWQTNLENAPHPIELALNNNLFVGNGQYIDEYDGTTYVSHVLDIQEGWQVACLAQFGVSYLAVGANFMGPSGSQICKIFLWTGESATIWDDEIAIPEQTIYAMIQHKGLWIFAGTTKLSIYYVPLGSRNAIRVWTFENTLPALYIPTVAMNGVTIRDGRIHFGYSVNVASSTENIPAVYSFNPDPTNMQMQGEFFNNSLSQTTAQSITFACVRSVQSSANPFIFISESATTFSLFRETESLTDPFSASSSLVNFETEDFNAPPGTKIYFEAFGIDTLLRSTGTITLEYMADDATSWTTIKAYQDTNGIGYYVPFQFECFTVKFRITFASVTGRIPWFLRRFYAMAHLVADPR